jgi:transposase
VAPPENNWIGIEVLEVTHDSGLQFGLRGHPNSPENGLGQRLHVGERNMIEAILWKHRTGAPWTDLPGEFGSWNSVSCRFNRWSKVGLWQTILEVLRIEADTFCWGSQNLGR